MSTQLAVFDLDGTITRSDTLLPYLAGYLRSHPRRLPRMLLGAPAVFAYALGRSDRGALKGALIHAVLGGLSQSVIKAWTASFVPRLQQGGLFAEALAAIAEHRARRAHLVLMSASPDLYIPAIGAALGFDEVICSHVRWLSNGPLEGHLDGPNCRGEEKVRQLELLIARYHPTHITAYGNSSADLPHLKRADEGVYVNGPPGGSLPANIRRVSWSGRN